MDRENVINIFNGVIEEFDDSKNINDLGDFDEDIRHSIFNEVIDKINDKQDKNIDKVEDKLGVYFDEPKLKEEKHKFKLYDGNDFLYKVNKKSLWRMRASFIALFDVDPDEELAASIYAGFRENNINEDEMVDDKQD